MFKKLAYTYYKIMLITKEFVLNLKEFERNYITIGFPTFKLPASTKTSLRLTR